MFEVDGYSQSDESFTLNWTKGGYQECRGSSHGGAFFIENVFEELDAPGEYFYDRKAKQLFLQWDAEKEHGEQLRFRVIARPGYLQQERLKDI